MKSIITLIILSFPIFANCAEVTFWGKIKNSTSTEIDIVLQSNDLLQEENIYRVKIDDKGEFSVVLPVTQPQVVRITANKKSLYLFASPKSSRLEFEYDVNSPAATLILKGKDIYNNSFYNSFCRTFGWNVEMKDGYEMGGLKTKVTPEIKRMATSYSKYDYFKIVEENRMSQINYLQTATSLSLDFYKFIEGEISWRYETNKIAYFLFNKERFPTNDLKLFWVRHALTQTANLNDEKSVTLSSYQNMLNAFIHYLHLQTPVKSKIGESYYTFISVNLQGKARYFMLAKLMLSNYQNFGNPNLAMKHLKSFKRENPFKEYNTQLSEVFGKESEFLTQKNAPELKVMGLNEEEIYLNQYSGKVVYVSFWASWCAPCIKGFQDSKDFRKEMERNGVVFLNINIDETENIWRKNLPKYEIVGKNVYGLDLKKAKEELKITSLPYYFLVNKSGKIDYLSSNKLTECRDDFMDFLRE